MTCAHGFIGACADCDGSGQEPEYDEDGEWREAVASMTPSRLQYEREDRRLYAELLAANTPEA